MRKKRPLFRKNTRIHDPDELQQRAQRKENRINKMRKGIFILPSLLTLTSIFFSFFAIISAINGDFVLAAALILVAGFFDGIDGKVARLTKTTTRFGLELDSLADVISFGVAPAILLYMWALGPYGRFGWVTAFVFTACGALRLARFNVQTGHIDPKRFNGLPIPAAAAMVATTVLFCQKLDLDPANLRVPVLALSFLLSFFMVSSVKFHAFKDLTLVKQKPFSSTVAFVLLLALIATAPFIVPFFLCAGYVVSGPVLTIMLYRRNKKRQAEKETDSDTSRPELSSLETKPKA
ncbi:MAG: CDP-diacylglycerol--serine O-phosphatidyltransferase [Desulfomonilaceae bacterium]|nr:CDP-diacylglycerol--serine O-phosphatidyltransferase [Desulfomonilaceae bacterium]